MLMRYFDRFRCGIEPAHKEGELLMRKLASVLSVVAVVAAASAVSAGEFRGPSPLFPSTAVFSFDEKPVEATPAPMADPVAAEGEVIELFKCVKYRDLDHIAPCAEPLVIKVLDPCWKPDPCACCQKPKCVYVMICVPKKQECTCCKPVAPPSCAAPVAPGCAAPAAPSCAAPVVAHGCAAPTAPACCAPKKCDCEKDKLRKITCTNNGAYTKYDYGKHRIEIRVKDGQVEVDYDN